MALLRWSFVAGIPALLMFGAALRADEPVADATQARPVAHLLMRPVQLDLMGPDPFDKPSIFGFRDIGWAIGAIGGVLAGVAIDNAIEHANSTHGMDKAARPLGDGFNFREAIHDKISRLDLETDFDIAEVHEQKFEGTGKPLSRWIMNRTDADYVLCLQPTYFISPRLDQLRFVVEVRLYTEIDVVNEVTGPYERYYEYLSPSRGELLRPFRDGEKAALIESVNRYFDQKTEQFPHNRKAYGKDRRQALKALNGSDTILPEMAILEGWPGDSIQIELQLATDNVMALVHADLMDPYATMPEDTEYHEFAGLDLKGRPATFKGHEIGTQGANTVYRDPEGNVYSVP